MILTSLHLLISGDVINHARDGIQVAQQTASKISSSSFPHGKIPPNHIPPADDEEYVAVCMAVRNQSLDLVEFLVHHYHHLGIRRFYIMDDGTIPPLSEYPHYGIPPSAISFSYYGPDTRVPKFQQHVLYSNCVEMYGDRHTWMAFFDADEFLEMTGNETLVEVLRSFEAQPHVGAVGVNWFQHTSNHQLTRQPSCRKAYTTCIHDAATDDNRHIKSIVKTALYLEPTSPHSFTTKDGTITVGENGDKVDYAFRVPITRSRFGLHHYVLKSREEWEQKMHRSNGRDDPVTWDLWNHLEALPHVECSGLASYYP